MDPSQRLLLFSMYYASMMSMAMHPGARKGCPPFQVSDFVYQENAKIALRMLFETESLEEELCRG